MALISWICLQPECDRTMEAPSTVQGVCPRCTSQMVPLQHAAGFAKECNKLRSTLSGLVVAMWAFQTRVPGLEPTYREPSGSELRVLTEMLEEADHVIGTPSAPTQP